MTDSEEGFPVTDEDNARPALRWRLTVTDSFRITRRGLVVVGTFEGHGRQRDPAIVTTGESTFRIDHVWFEVLSRKRLDQPAIILGDLEKDQVPIGSVVHSVD